ncbi:MAG: 50S ribosomal protein L23 [Oscillospiraceae bacterium]|jgi:large subunit ribosomal protein L23|nr:50S ribosomal protein L23 [Oscillospiraceae bacterium]
MISYDVIVRPVISERSMAAVADKKYVFEVATAAGKIEIKKAVEEAFGVKVAKVNTMIVPGKAKRMGAGRPGRTKEWKKAIVQLTEDSKTIELFEGMV